MYWLSVQRQTDEKGEEILAGDFHAVGVEHRPSVHSPHQNASVRQILYFLVTVLPFERSVFLPVIGKPCRICVFVDGQARDAITCGQPYLPVPVFRDGMDEVVG